MELQQVPENAKLYMFNFSQISSNKKLIQKQSEFKKHFILSLCHLANTTNKNIKSLSTYLNKPGHGQFFDIYCSKLFLRRNRQMS